jgi:hypothetical protein
MEVTTDAPTLTFIVIMVEYETLASKILDFPDSKIKYPCGILDAFALPETSSTKATSNLGLSVTLCCCKHRNFKQHVCTPENACSGTDPAEKAFQLLCNYSCCNFEGKFDLGKNMIINLISNKEMFKIFMKTAKIVGLFWSNFFLCLYPGSAGSLIFCLGNCWNHTFKSL